MVVTRIPYSAIGNRTFSYLRRRFCWKQQYRILSRTYSWKNFTLEDDLTLEIKRSIEKKWAKDVYGVKCPAELSKNNNPIQESTKYVLSMFPYPSGKLHLGHVRVYTLSDVIARFYRLQGHAVIHPMGWDAFGLPAENAARDHGVEAEKWTRDNIEFMKKQIIDMGCCFDWDREFATCDPSYFKWTQWLFTKLWEQGLVYKKLAYVYWDPVDKTVLAEEQVDSEMRSWRSGAKVEKRLLSQWFVKTSAFAEQLMSELTTGNLKEGWRNVIDLQKHWIGTIRGYSCESKVSLKDILQGTSKGSMEEPLRIWFSNTEALKNTKCFILKPDHFLSKDENAILKVYENGIKLLKFTLKNPLTGESVPVISGPSEIMPLVPESSDCRTDERLPEDLEELTTNEDTLNVISELDLQKPSSSDAVPNPNFLHYPASLKLRDWLVSRQRKWGTPIPVVNCQDCGNSSVVSEEMLPVSSATIIQDHCKHCGSENLQLETDTLDTFFDSSWYFIRYLDPSNESKIFNPVKIQNDLPVDVYIGGIEHATLHLYYARFMNHFLYNLGHVPAREPFQRLIPIGVVMGQVHCSKSTGKYLKPEEITQEENKITETATGEPVVSSWEKMSKSKFNGIDPEVVLNEFGIDTARLLSISEAAPTSARHWPPNNVHGFLNWQLRMWTLMRSFVDEKDFGSILFADDEEWGTSEAKIFDARNYYLKGITHNYGQTFQISVVVSRLQGMLGALRGVPTKYLKDSIEFERAFGVLIICMYPIVPAFSAQLWQSFRGVAIHTELDFDLDQEVWKQTWPEVDQNYQLDLISVIQGEEFIVKVERQYLDAMDEDTALELAFENEEIAQKISKETTKVTSYVVEPGFRATLRLHDPTAPRIKKKKKKAKAKNDIKAESSA